MNPSSKCLQSNRRLITSLRIQTRLAPSSIWGSSQTHLKCLKFRSLNLEWRKENHFQIRSRRHFIKPKFKNRCKRQAKGIEGSKTRRFLSQTKAHHLLRSLIWAMTPSTSRQNWRRARKGREFHLILISKEVMLTRCQKAPLLRWTKGWRKLWRKWSSKFKSRSKSNLQTCGATPSTSSSLKLKTKTTASKFTSKRVKRAL